MKTSAHSMKKVHAYFSETSQIKEDKNLHF